MLGHGIVFQDAMLNIKNKIFVLSLASRCNALYYNYDFVLSLVRINCIFDGEEIKGYKIT